MKKIRIKRSIQSLNETLEDQKIDRSKIKIQTLKDMLDDLESDFRKTYNPDAYMRERRKASDNLHSIVNRRDISKIRVLERTNYETGEKEQCQPYRLAALCRAVMQNMAADSQLKVFTKYFPKSIIWTDHPLLQTAATDGARIYFNVWFVDTLFGEDMKLFASDSQINPRAVKASYTGLAFKFVLIHEIYHQLYQHFHREQIKPETRNGANHELSNICQDIEINRDIIAQFPQQFSKIVPQLHACLDSRFPNEPWEQIFDAYQGGMQPPKMKNAMSQQSQGSQQGNQQGQQGNQQGQQGNQQGQQGQQGNQQGQQGGQSGGAQSRGGSMSGQMDPLMSDSAIQGANDAVRDIKEGRNNSLTPLDPNQPLPGNPGAGNSDFNEGEYREGYNAVCEAAQKAIDDMKAKQAQSQGSAGGQQSQDDANASGDGADGEADEEAMYGSAENPIQSDYDSSNDSTFNKPDRLSADDLRKIAEESGQPLDADDIETASNPGKRARDFSNSNESELGKIGGTGKGSATTNLMQKIRDIESMLKPKINWKSKLMPWLRGVVKLDKVRKYSQKLVGSRNKEHELIRYTKPKIVTPQGKGGITQVLHVIDGSGSMYGGATGEKKFDYVFKEIAKLANTIQVECSRAVFFSGYMLKREQFAEWTHKDSPSKILTKVKNVGINAGGTELAKTLEYLVKMGKPFYSLSNPTTLIIVYTDGDVDYKDHHEKLPKELKRNIVFVTIASKGTLESTKRTLAECGYNVEKQFIPVDEDEIAREM